MVSEVNITTPRAATVTANGVLNNQKDCNQPKLLFVFTDCSCVSNSSGIIPTTRFACKVHGLTDQADEQRRTKPEIRKPGSGLAGNHRRDAQ
jgi:hypothetical protein